MSDPLVFGPRLWAWTHLTARRLDALTAHRDYLEPKSEVMAQVEVLHDFLEKLPFHTPCPACVTHIRAFMETSPVPPLPKTRQEQENPSLVFFRWSVDAHNHANRLTQKRELTYDEAMDAFMETWLHPDVGGAAGYAQRQRLEDHAKIRLLEADVGAVHERQVQTRLLIAAVALTAAVLVLALLHFAINLRTRRGPRGP